MSETCRVSCQNKFSEIIASSWFYYKEYQTLIEPDHEDGGTVRLRNMDSYVPIDTA